MSEEELEGVSPLAAPASRMKPARYTQLEESDTIMIDKITGMGSKAMVQHIVQRAIHDNETFLEVGLIYGIPLCIIDDSYTPEKEQVIIEQIRSALRPAFDIEDQTLPLLWEIARVVAAGDATCYDDAYGTNECPFCSGEQLYIAEGDKVKHDKTCIVSKARALIAEKKEPIDGQQ